MIRIKPPLAHFPKSRQFWRGRRLRRYNRHAGHSGHSAGRSAGHQTHPPSDSKYHLFTLKVGRHSYAPVRFVASIDTQHGRSLAPAPVAPAMDLVLRSIRLWWSSVGSSRNTPGTCSAAGSGGRNSPKLWKKQKPSVWCERDTPRALRWPKPSTLAACKKNCCAGSGSRTQRGHKNTASRQEVSHVQGYDDPAHQYPDQQ